jgi:DNA-binding LacI/PurR family transcriptional regulator
MPVSIREIARLSGVSVATVSRTLQGKGRASQATRDRIISIARSYGYVPDPLLSRAFSYIRTPGRQGYRETLALIIEWPTEEGPDSQKFIHAGASEQAAAMGYKLEAFTVSGRPSDQRRLSRMIQARGIRGVIVIPRLGSTRARLDFNWSKFAGVEIGRTLWYPTNLHRVESGGYQKVLEAFHILKKIGYKRIGMAVEPTQNRHQHGIYYSAFLLTQLNLPARNRVPIFAPNGLWNESTFRHWLRREKPDVLFLNKVNTLSVWLEKLHVRVPQDLSLFCANAPAPHWSGLRRDYSGMGRRAVELAAQLLSNDKIGLYGNPHSIQIDEFWQAGETLSRPISKLLTPEGFLRSYFEPLREK